jgi:hypothetical protein
MSNFQDFMTKISAKLEELWLKFYEDYQLGLFLSTFHRINPKFSDVFVHSLKTSGFIENLQAQLVLKKTVSSPVLKILSGLISIEIPATKIFKASWYFANTHKLAHRRRFKITDDVTATIKLIAKDLSKY